MFRDLLTFMMEDPRNITFCTHLLFCSKNIERIGDHTTNIAETIVYLVTGDGDADGASARRNGRSGGREMNGVATSSPPVTTRARRKRAARARGRGRAGARPPARL